MPYVISERVYGTLRQREEGHLQKGKWSSFVTFPVSI